MPTSFLAPREEGPILRSEDRIELRARVAQRRQARAVHLRCDESGKPAILEVDRSSEFAPIKNAVGEDSPESCRQAQNDLYGGWLESRGVEVARGEDGHVLADIEISPLSAMGADQMTLQDLPAAVGSNDRILI